VSVAVSSANDLANTALTAYVDATNAIVAGTAAPETIREVTSPAWADEEIAGFAVATAIDSGSETPIAVTQSDVARIRGGSSVVDVTLHVCFAAHGVATLASVRLVPRAGALVVDSIRPWEDSTWCEPSSPL
jgi:hypothetical protein